MARSCAPSDLIRRLKREAPEREIVVTGCAAQIDPQAFAAMPEVAKILGNGEKLRAFRSDPPSEARGAGARDRRHRLRRADRSASFCRHAGGRENSRQWREAARLQI